MVLGHSQSRWLLLAAVVLLALAAFPVWSKNGFDLSESTIPEEEILAGGPPRDGIPALHHPQFLPANKVDYLRADDIVIGVTKGDTARAYPTRILVWHEIVNDTIGGQAIAVTYCPLCGTGMVFDRHINGQTLSFGVSGLLYHSDVLMYDLQSESLWSQLGMKAISGTAVNSTLTWLPSEHLTWRSWQEKYPQGEVLSLDTGYVRHYGDELYADYFAFDSPVFPVPQYRDELPQKSKVVGVIVNGVAKAYPLKGLPASLSDTVGDRDIVVRYNREQQYPRITLAQGETIPSVVAFWFAWQAFHPQTELWSSE